MVKEQRIRDIRRCDRRNERSAPGILTQDPDIEASKKLLDLVDIITKTDKESFAVAFNGWYEKYKDVINERVRDKQNVKYLLICARDCEVRI